MLPRLAIDACSRLAIGKSSVHVVPPYPVPPGDVRFRVCEHLRVSGGDLGRVAELNHAARVARGGLQRSRTLLAASGIRAERALRVVTIGGEAARQHYGVLHALSGALSVVR